MLAVEHNAKFARRAGIAQTVGHEFGLGRKNMSKTALARLPERKRPKTAAES
jgi:hypothetical protein